MVWSLGFRVWGLRFRRGSIGKRVYGLLGIYFKTGSVRAKSCRHQLHEKHKVWRPRASAQIRGTILGSSS